ncbi:hypothetical protein OROGR_029498 [Orobanche gracilis]
MPRYEDSYGTRLYVGHLSSRTRSRDLEHIFSRYGRCSKLLPDLMSMVGRLDLPDMVVNGERVDLVDTVRDVDMKRDYAFIEFSDPRDADDARYKLDGKDVDGRHITVEFARGLFHGDMEGLEIGNMVAAGVLFPDLGGVSIVGLRAIGPEIARLETGKTSVTDAGNEVM